MGAYIINLDKFESIGTQWIALDVNAENVTYFDSFGVEYIPKKIRKFIGNKNIITNIYRIQAYDSVLRIQIYIPLMSIKRMAKNIKIFSVESK